MPVANRDAVPELQTRADGRGAAPPTVRASDATVDRSKVESSEGADAADFTPLGESQGLALW